MAVPADVVVGVRGDGDIEHFGTQRKNAIRVVVPVKALFAREILTELLRDRVHRRPRTHEVALFPNRVSTT